MTFLESFLSVQYIDIDPARAYAMLNSGEIALVIDTREVHEWTAERIAGSLVVPVPSGEPQVLARLQQAGPPKDRPVLVHCRSGVRSLRVMPQIAAYGFVTIYHLPGGFLSWKAAGLPVASGAQGT